MFKNKLKFYLIAIAVSIACVSGVVLADTIINHYYGEMPVPEGNLGSVVAVGGVCDGSEPTTQLCNVNAYELQVQTDVTIDDDLVVTDTVTIGGETTYRAKTTAVAQTSTFGTTTLTVADSGTTYLISATGSEFILPATSTSDGVWFRFMIDGDMDTASTTIWGSSLGSSSDVLEGSLMVAGAIVDCAAADYISIGYSTENIGDSVTVLCNGSDWLVYSSNFLTAKAAMCGG